MGRSWTRGAAAMNFHAHAHRPSTGVLSLNLSNGVAHFSSTCLIYIFAHVFAWRPAMRWGDDGSECLQAVGDTRIGWKPSSEPVQIGFFGKMWIRFWHIHNSESITCSKGWNDGGFDWDLSYTGAVLWGMSLYQMSHLVNYYLSTITPNIPPPIWASGASIGACNSIKPSFQVFFKKYFDIGGPVNSP